MRKLSTFCFLIFVAAFLICAPLQAMGANNCTLDSNKYFFQDTNNYAKIQRISLNRTFNKIYRYRITIPSRKYTITNRDNIGSPADDAQNIIAKYKDYGSDVFKIENMLSKLGYRVSVSKFFGYNTLLAVKKFQKQVDLPVTGQVDQATLDELRRQVEISSSDQETPQQEDSDKQENPDKQGDSGEKENDEQDASGENSYEQQTDQENNSILTAEEQQMINLVNKERTERGLSPLKVDKSLVKTARMKSRDMVQNNYFAHQSPTYGSPFDLMRSQGVSYKYAGENLAGAPTVESAHTNLMNSSGHRANILNSSFTHIGVGIVDGGSYGKMFTQHFVGR